MVENSNELRPMRLTLTFCPRADGLTATEVATLIGKKRGSFVRTQSLLFLWLRDLIPLLDLHNFSSFSTDSLCVPEFDSERNRVEHDDSVLTFRIQIHPESDYDLYKALTPIPWGGRAGFLKQCTIAGFWLNSRKDSLLQLLSAVKQGNYSASPIGHTDPTTAVKEQPNDIERLAADSFFSSFDTFREEIT